MTMLLYSKDQPRIPKGAPGAGRFAPGDGAARKSGSGQSYAERLAIAKKAQIPRTSAISHLLPDGQTKQCVGCTKMLNGPMEGQKLGFVAHMRWSHGICPECAKVYAQVMLKKARGQELTPDEKAWNAHREYLEKTAFWAKEADAQLAEGRGMKTLGQLWRQPIRLSEGADGKMSSWLMLMPEGNYEHPDYGHIHFTRAKLSEFKRNFDDRVRKIDIALDVDHKAGSEDSRATGWIEEMQLRPAQGEIPAGLWGRIAWTPYGAKLLNDREYKYFSPEFGTYTDEETGTKYENVIIGGALTNRPFLKVMPSVSLSERRRQLERWYADQHAVGQTDQQIWQKMKMGEAPMALDELIKLAQKTPLHPKGNGGNAKASKVTDYDPDDVSNATAFDDSEAEDDSASMDDGESDDDSASYDEGDADEDAAMDDGGDDSDAADSAPMSSKGRGQKMSSSGFGGKKAAPFAKGGGRKAMSESSRVTLKEEVQQLREQVARQQFKLYEQSVRDQVERWQDQIVALGEEVAIAPKFAARYQRFMLGETGVRLSEGARRELNGVIEAALASALVDLSRRGSSFDQETRRTVKGGKRNGDVVGVELHDVAQRMALQERKTWDKLTYEQKQEYYLAAEAAQR